MEKRALNCVTIFLPMDKKGKEQNLHLAQALLKQCINQLKTGLMEHQMHLDENPLTLPVAVHPEVNKKALEEYLQSLRQLLEHHRETHIKNNTPS